MKLSHIAVLLTATTLGLSGCQTSKNLLNGFTGGQISNAKLPENSSSRIQFVLTEASGEFIAAPNSKNVKANGKSLGLVAVRKVNSDRILFNKEQNLKLSSSDLGMGKFLLAVEKPNNIVERYVNSNEQITIKYVTNKNNGRTTSHCSIGGNFTPEVNTDYRITGRSDYKKCYIRLEKFVKNTDGTTTLQPMRFE